MSFKTFSAFESFFTLFIRYKNISFISKKIFGVKSYILITYLITDQFFGYVDDLVHEYDLFNIIFIMTLVY